ncbi:hypothetical protein BpHYR1_014878 [Brachionus plicatilis]|uniref:Uncharacterized protein n=1 Tax=Brachionus plicatilis TaxID=10195 RepID=A0A3M7T8A7_BRAPC|nr:hypothetical protein BpHYR1_014878 [Brachionus plicatilis]
MVYSKKNYNREAELFMRKYEISYGNIFFNVCINLNFRHHRLFFTALSDFLRPAKHVLIKLVTASSFLEIKLN